jgi:hypothetical protein
MERFEAIAEIELHRGTVPRGNRKTFDAHGIIDMLGPAIEHPQH